MIKITKSQLRANLPANVAEYAEQHLGNRRVLYYTYHADGDTLYLDEGATYLFFRGEKREPERVVNMMSERTLHNDPDKLAWKVGAKIPFPAGTYVIEDEIFLGKRLIIVHAWGIRALAGGAR